MFIKSIIVEISVHLVVRVYSLVQSKCNILRLWKKRISVEKMSSQPWSNVLLPPCIGTSRASWIIGVTCFWVVLVWCLKLDWLSELKFCLCFHLSPLFCDLRSIPLPGHLWSRQVCQHDGRIACQARRPFHACSIARPARQVWQQVPLS